MFFFVLGSPKHGALFWPVQPDQASGDLPEMGRSNHGGVLPARWSRTRSRNRDFAHVRQIQRDNWKITGKEKKGSSINPTYVTLNCFLDLMLLNSQKFSPRTKPINFQCFKFIELIPVCICTFARAHKHISLSKIVKMCDPLVDLSSECLESIL